MRIPTVEVWSYAEVAEWTGLTTGNLRLRNKDGRMPAPDGVAGPGNGHPYWMEQTIRRWAPEGRVRDTRYKVAV